LHQKSLG